jgi:hypothetical protein
MVMLPRRSGIVPSSSTVTPGAAILWPISPAKAEVFLRLKSPSSPWPMASCSRMPGQPGPRTTSIIPAGAAHGAQVHPRDADRLGAIGCQVAGVHQPARPCRPPPPGAAAFAPAVLLDDDGDVQPRHRADVGQPQPFGAQDLHLLQLAPSEAVTCTTRGSSGAGIGVDLAQKVDLGGKGRVGHRVGGG